MTPPLVSKAGWLLAQSLEVVLLGPMLPWFWASGIVLAFAAFVGRHRESQQRSRMALFEFAILFLVPLAMVVWAAMFYGVTEGISGRGRWQELGVWGLFTLQTLIAVVLVRRHEARVSLALFFSLAATLWGASACLVGLMAVSNDWL